jgi:hypothetical protein
VNWALMPGSTGYQVFGRTTGAELLIATVGSCTAPTGAAVPLTYVDTGSVTPSGALNATNGTLNYYTVPQALGVGGSCTSPPKALLTVTTGALSACTVWQAGSGCGTGTGLTWVIQGGGGTGGTVTPAWTGGAMTSCTASGGSGYTSTNYSNAGHGGDGYPGWYVEFAAGTQVH